MPKRGGRILQRPRLLILRLLFFVLAICPPAGGGETSSWRPGDSKQPLTRLLSYLGELHDIHFTIEEAWKHGEIGNSIGSFRFSFKMAEPTNLESDLERLRSALPRADLYRNKKITKIIHIKDQRLRTLKGYPLDLTLGHLKFQGSPSKLLKGLKEKVPGFEDGLFIVYSTPQPAGITYIDRVSQMQFVVQEQSVRDILSHHLPFAHYSRILWVARTGIEGPVETTIGFGGPRNPYLSIEKVEPAKPSLSPGNGDPTPTTHPEQIEFVTPDKPRGDDQDAPSSEDLQAASKPSTREDSRPGQRPWLIITVSGIALGMCCLAWLILRRRR